MTDDEIVALGSFCKTLMCHSAWAVVVEHIMTTKPHEQKWAADDPKVVLWCGKAVELAKITQK